MARVTDLPNALARWGLQVEVVPGWDTRGSSTFNPRGAVCHWTAGPRTGDRPSLRVCTDGHGSLPGPLCNVFLSRGGVAVVVAAGRANHAGKGGWKGLTGNSSVFGTEAECSGGGEWTDAQRWAYPRINAAFCQLGGFGPEMVCSHHEWAPTRKVDIKDWPISLMREQVAQLLRGEDDMTPEERSALFEIRDRQRHIGSDVWGYQLEHRGRKAPALVYLVDLLVGQQDGQSPVLRAIADAVQANTDPAAIAAATVAGLEPVIRDAVKDVVSEGQADAIVNAIAERLASK